MHNGESHKVPPSFNDVEVDTDLVLLAEDTALSDGKYTPQAMKDSVLRKRDKR